MVRAGVLASLLALAACAHTPVGGWSKAGADEAATADAYRDCRMLSDTASRTDADIDQDIAASRASDLQHASIVRQQSQDLRKDNAERADAVIASCMQAKGFTPTK